MKQVLRAGKTIKYAVENATDNTIASLNEGQEDRYYVKNYSIVGAYNTIKLFDSEDVDGSFYGINVYQLDNGAIVALPDFHEADNDDFDMIGSDGNVYNWNGSEIV